MKKSSSITLGGILLHIEEDAYELLKSYIDSLELHFKNDSDKTDILEDIELRLAELLSEQLADKNSPVTKEMVEKAIATMGKPQDFEDGNDSKEFNEESYSQAENTYKKRLFRNPEGKIIGGVCSGLGTYFDIDPVIIRIGLVVLALLGIGFTIPLYIILWIVVPEAKTVTQRMQMTGESINIDSIKRNAKLGVDEIKNTVNNFARDKQTKNAFAKIGIFIGKVAPLVFKIIFGFSIAGICIGIMGLIALELSPKLIDLGLPPTVNPKAIYLIKHIDISLLGIGALIIAAAAVTTIFHMLPNIIFNNQSNNKSTGYIVAALTILGIIIMIVGLTKSIIDYQTVKEFIYYNNGKN
jgi:phage shock protein PspC (stress-responsive transcriptional regulator)